jgi:subtilisin family serine protease
VRSTRLQVGMEALRVIGMSALALGLLGGSAWADSRYILRAASETDARQVAAKYSLLVEKKLGDGDSASFAVSAPSALSSTTITAIRAETGVRWLEADVRHREAETESGSKAAYTIDSLPDVLSGSLEIDYFGSVVRGGYATQRAAQIIALPQAQQKYRTGSGVVAIIDTGVDVNHPALRGVLLPGYDFTRDNADTVSELSDLGMAGASLVENSRQATQSGKVLPFALNQSTVAILDQSTVAILDQSTVAILDGTLLPKAFGHGTMAAGLVHLVAPTARILPLKAFRGDGTADLSNIARAVRYAADHGATVISMSFSSTSSSAELQDAIVYAQSKGVLCVASAGNLGKESTVYPAGYRKVLGVGSTNASDRRSGFSNYGGSVGTSAPGEALITTYPGNNYAGVWGTSFSSALVAGAVALCAQAYPGLRYDALKDAIAAGPHISQDMGDARLDVSRVLGYCAEQ